MLRGHSRPCHDGISNKQSAKERDRDRQRERQKKERALMLPRDEDKDSTCAQDLFHAPVKVEPSVEDRTTLEIRNTLGNFEHVRHYVVDGASGRNLIGVDQNSNNPAHRASRQSGTSTTNNSSSSSGSSSTKNPTIQTNSHRNYPTTNNTVVPNSINNNNVKTSNVIHKVPQSQNNQLPHYSSQSGTTTTTNTSNNNNNSVLVPGQLHSGKKSSGGFNNNVFNNSVSEVGGVPVPTKLDKTLNNHNNNSVSLSADTFCTEIINEKSDRGGHSKNKPTLERVDNFELESMLKEMIDVATPLTPALTPKESPTKKYTPRRASKSEEKIVQSIVREGMTNIPSPIKKMDSSDSSSSDSESSGSASDSEDSSSSSQRGTENQEEESTIAKPPTTNSPTRWNLSSFITSVRKDNVKGTPDSSGATATIKSPKDGKSRERDNASTIDSEESPGEVPIKLESSVTSTSVFGKSVSGNSPGDLPASSSGKITSNKPSNLDSNEGPYSKVPGKSPRKTPEVKQEASIPINKSTTIPKSTSASSNSTVRKGGGGGGGGVSLSATSSEDEDEDKKPTKEKSLSRSIPPDKKPRTGGKQRSTERKQKRPRRSSSSSDPTVTKSDDDDSSPETDKPKNDKNKNKTILKLFQRPAKKIKTESPNREIDDNKGGSSNRGRGKGGSSAVTNRVLAKDARKNTATTSSAVHNGDLESKANNNNTKTSSSSGNSTGKKRGSSKDASSSSHSSHHHGRKHGHKTHSNPSSSQNKIINELGTSATNNPSSIVVSSRAKEEATNKSHQTSLICRIPLSILPRPPTNSAIIKLEKGDSSHRVSRVGSSSDQALQESHGDDDDAGSDSEENTTPKSHSSRIRVKKKPRSPKKPPKTRREQPDSHSKNDVETEVGEVSSNVCGYAPCDSVSVSTTRTPPGVEFDVVQAPDSSINPLHLPSPAVPPQPIYYSYFEHNEQHHEDYYSRDQDAYLEEAKRLKHKADNEKLGTAQASMYLEAGLYFILTGITMERDRAVGSQAAFTMYKDTLTLIRYIGNRFRIGRPDQNVLEAKIIVLSMRCQSLLSLKLYKIKSRETKEVVQYLTDHFAKVPPMEVVPIPNSPQLSTPSPHSPTSCSPAGSSSSGLLPGHTPSPHPHQNHHVATVPRSIYAQMYKQCNSTMNLINAHELWETADSLVERYHMEEFFISIDRQCGPLTLHNSLVDLVRYVKHGLHLLKLLKICSDIS